jgi:hypothetical protein
VTSRGSDFLRKQLCSFSPGRKTFDNTESFLWMTSLYDQKGNPFVQGISYYKDPQGRLLRVPSMFGPKEEIMKYLLICFETGIRKGEKVEINEGLVVIYLEEIWADAEKKTEKILEMLDRRARALKEEKSIRNLLYTKTREILSKLTIPIFNRRQLENIPNISRDIIDEIDTILNS